MTRFWKYFPWAIMVASFFLGTTDAATEVDQAILSKFFAASGLCGIVFLFIKAKPCGYRWWKLPHGWWLYAIPIVFASLLHPSLLGMNIGLGLGAFVWNFTYRDRT